MKEKSEKERKEELRKFYKQIMKDKPPLPDNLPELEKYMERTHGVSKEELDKEMEEWREVEEEWRLNEVIKVVGKIALFVIFVYCIYIYFS